MLGSCPCEYLETIYIDIFFFSFFKEHSKSDKESAVREHTLSSGHSISLENVRILANESRYNPRKIRQALEIYKNNPKLNRDQAVISIFQQQSSIRPCTERSKRQQIST